MNFKNYIQKIITLGVALFLTNYSYSQVCLTNVGMSTGKAISTATDITIGNFDADLIPDIATANGASNNVSIFTGNGDGTFKAPLTITPDINFKNPIAITSGDFNKDSFLDLATANGTSDNVAIFLSKGKGGGFNAPIYVAVDKGLTDIVAGDFNKDLIIDIAVTSAGGNAPLFVLFNKGGAVFNIKPFGASGSSARALTANDFDKHVGVDFAISTDLGIDVFLSADAYTKPYSQAVDKYCLGIDSKDINKDGIVDLVAANNAKNVVSVMLGKGNGTFSDVTIFNAGTNPFAINIDDYNGDGYEDIASTSTSQINIFQGDGNGSFSVPMNFTSAGARALVSAKLDTKATNHLVYAAPGLTNDVVVVTNSANTTQLTLTASETNVCPNTSVTFNAGKEYGSYLWFDGSIFPTTVATPKATTDYYVVGTTVSNITKYCKDIANITVTVKPVPTATMSAGSTSICAGNTASIPVTFSGTIGPWTINYNQGTISKTITGIKENPYLGITSGPTGVQYSAVSVTDINGCTGSFTGKATITQTLSPFATISYASPYCKNATNPTPSLGNGATLGTFTSSSTSLKVDLNKGIIDLANSLPGTYIVTNTVIGACGNVIDTARVVISPLPTASFKYPQNAYCSNSTSPSTSSYTGGGAAYTSSPAGLTIDAFKGNITISSSLPGTYTVTNTVTGCGVGTATATVTITKSPDASFSYVGGPFCKNASNPLPTVGENAKLETINTVYTGLFVDKTTGAIDLKTSTPGNNYMVTNTIAAAGGCSQVTAYATLSIVDVPTASFTSSTTSICNGDKATLNLKFTGTPDFTYAFSDGSTYTTNTNTASITLVPSANTTYTLVKVSDKNCTTNASGSVAVTVNPYPSVTFNPVTKICLNAPNLTLSATPSGGIFSGSGVSGNIFTPRTKGNNTINYSYSTLGCTTTVSKNIFVDTLPRVNLASISNNVCAGTNVTLTASGANSYTWSNGLPNGATNNVAPLTNSSYTVTGTDVNGCSNTANTKINVIALPIVKANATTNPVCEGASTSLFGSVAGITSGITYTWDNGMVNNLAFVPTVGQTKYKVQAKDKDGCTGIDSITVTVNPKPVITVKPLNSTICSSSSTNIFVTSSIPAEISWTTVGSSTNLIGVSAGNSGKTNPVLNYNIVQKIRNLSLTQFQAKYAVSAMSTLGCVSDVTTATVNVDSCAVKADFSVSKSLVCIDNPTVTFSNNSLTSSNSTYSWDFGPNAIPQTSTSATPPPVKFTAPGNQTIKLTVKDILLNTTNIKSSIAVYVAPQPTIVAPDQAFCAGSNGVLLKASGANIYSPFANTIVKPLKDTTYQLIGTDLNGCKDTVPVKVKVNAIPSLKLTATPNIVCKGATTQVSAINQLTGIITSFAWNKNVLPNKPFDPIQTQYFTVTATDANGCIKKDSVLVTVNPIPLVKANASNTVACSGDSIKLTGAVTNLANISYAWDNGAINNKNFAVTATKKYTVTATETTTLCANTDTISVKVNAFPNVVLKNDTICAGSNVNLSASGAIYYQWFNGNTLLSNLVVSPSTTTTYKVIGTDANGCSISKLKTVLVNQKPTLTLSNKNITVCAGQSTVLNATSNASSVIWNDATITNNVSFIPSASKQYIATASLLGCIKNDTVTLTVNPNPIVSINASSKEVCAGDSVRINAIGTSGATYTWNNGITNNKPFTPSVSNKYIVIALFNGCSSKDSVQITVNKLPVLTATSASTLCNGSATNISIQTDIASRIKWVVTTSNVIGATSDSIDVLANASNSIQQILKNTAKSGKATYNIFATNKSCFGNTSSITLTVDTCNAKADFIANKSSICSLDTTVLFTDNSQGAVSWNWDFGTGATPQTSTSKNPQAVKYSVAGNKFISLIVKGLDGTFDTITKNIVNVNLVNTPTIQTFTNTFTQDSISTKAQITNPLSGASYKWFVSPSTSLVVNNTTANPTLTFNTAVSGKTTLKVLTVNAQGCISDTSASVSITRKGKFTLATPSAVFYNDSIPVNIDFVGSKPYYLYYQNGTQRDTILNITTNNVKFKIARLGTLTVTAFDKDSIPMQGFGNNVNVALDTVNTTISTVTPLCQNNTGKVYLNTLGGNKPLSLKLGTASPINLTGNDTLSLSSGTYTGTITDKSGFVSNISFKIDTVAVGKITISRTNGNAVYTNDPSTTNPLPILTTTAIAIATNYVWSYNSQAIDSLSTINALSKKVSIKNRYSGILKFTVNAFNGTCLIASSDTFNLTINPAAKLLSTSKNQLSVDLIGKSPFRVNYTLNNTQKDSLVNDSTFVYDVKANETIRINSITDIFGNVTPSTITFTGEAFKFQELEFYQAFSPNNDDKNQFFKIQNYMDTITQAYINGAASFTVYDRNGFEIYSVSPFRNDWEGKDSKGADLPDGVYFFVVNRAAKDEKGNPKKDTYGSFVEIRR